MRSAALPDKPIIAYRHGPTKGGPSSLATLALGILAIYCRGMSSLDMMTFPPNKLPDVTKNSYPDLPLITTSSHYQSPQ